MAFGHHEEVDRKQRELDQFDQLMDEQISTDPARASEMTDLYLTRVDELQDRLVALQEDAGEMGVRLDYSVMSTLASQLRNISPYNFEEKAGSFAESLEEQLRLVEGLEQQVEVPEEFYNLSALLDYGPKEMADYYQVYKRVPEGLRLDFEDMHMMLTDVDAQLDRLMFAAKLDRVPQRAAMLAEAFGYLVNGDLDSFEAHMDRLDLEAEYHESQRAMEDNGKLEIKLREIQTDIESKNKEAEQLSREIAALQRKNPHWAKFWERHYDEEISQLLFKLRVVELTRSWRQNELISRQDRVLKNNATIYRFQYRYGVASGVPQARLDYLLLDMSKTLGSEMPEDLQDDLADSYERVVSSDDLSEFNLAYYTDNPLAMTIAVEDYNGVADEENPKEQQDHLIMALENDLSLSLLRDESKNIYGKLGPVSTLFQASLEGNRSATFVRDMKEKARDLKAAYSGENLRMLLADAHQTLDALQGLDIGYEESEFEAMLNATMESITQFEELIYSDTVNTLCDGILDNSYSEASLNQWIKTSGVVLVTAVASGIAVMTVVGAPAGLTGFGLVAFSAAMMATGSVVGAEIGKEISGAVFDTGLGSNLRRCIEGEITYDELLTGYAKEWAMSAATTFLFMAAGRVLATQIGNLASMDVAYLSQLARHTQTLVSKTSGAFDVLPNSGGALGAYFHELTEEIMQEMAENIAQGIDPRLGTVMTLINSMSGPNVNLDGSFGVSRLETTRKGTNINTRFEYANSLQDGLVENLRSTYGPSAVKVNADGLIRVTVESKVRGKTYTNTMDFQGTRESVAMRSTLRKSLKEGQSMRESVLVRHYGLTYDPGSNGYTYRTLSEGWSQEGLLSYLEGDGYIILPSSKTGVFMARKGSAVVTFQPQGAPRSSDLTTLRNSTTVASEAEPVVDTRTEYDDLASTTRLKEKRAKLKEQLDNGDLSREQYRLEVRELIRHSMADRMTRVIREFDSNLADFDSFTSEELAEEAARRMSEQGVHLTSKMKEMIRDGAERYVEIREDIRPWRERVQTPEGKQEFLSAVGLGHVDPNDVEVDLSHPLFIGVQFYNLSDATSVFHQRDVTAYEADDFLKVGGWVSHRQLPGAPELEGSIYYVNPASRRDPSSTISHELQHVMYGLIYNPSGDLWDDSDPKSESLLVKNVEGNFLNESLAYLKGGDFETGPVHLSSWPSNYLEDVSPTQKTVFKAKLSLLSKIYLEAQEKGISPQELWGVGQTTRNFDDFIARLYTHVYTPTERRAHRETLFAQVPSHVVNPRLSEGAQILQALVYRQEFSNAWSYLDVSATMVINPEANEAALLAKLQERVRAEMPHKYDQIFSNPSLTAMDRYWIFRAERAIGDISPKERALFTSQNLPADYAQASPKEYFQMVEFSSKRMDPTFEYFLNTEGKLGGLISYQTIAEDLRRYPISYAQKVQTLDFLARYETSFNSGFYPPEFFAELDAIQNNAFLKGALERIVKRQINSQHPNSPLVGSEFSYDPWSGAELTLADLYRHHQILNFTSNLSPAEARVYVDRLRSSGVQTTAEQYHEILQYHNELASAVADSTDPIYSENPARQAGVRKLLFNGIPNLTQRNVAANLILRELGLPTTVDDLPTVEQNPDQSTVKVGERFSVVRPHDGAQLKGVVLSADPNGEVLFWGTDSSISDEPFVFTTGYEFLVNQKGKLTEKPKTSIDVSSTKYIAPELRQALSNNHEVSYENYGERKVISVQRGGLTYKFSQDYDQWVMAIYTNNGNLVDSVEVEDDAEVEYLEQLSKQDLNPNLRKSLDEGREISYEEYGERKVVSVKYGDKTYRFYRDSTLEYSEWAMETRDQDGKYLDSVDIREDADVEYLEQLFQQDLNPGLRQALEQHGEVSYEDYGDRKVISVEYRDKTYRFYRDSTLEYSEWAMETRDQDGKYLDSVDIREDADVEYLEDLFEKMD